MPSLCSYYRCMNVVGQKPMFHFPIRDDARLQAWIENCGNMTIAHLSKEELFKKLICFDHFDQHSFTNDSGKRKRLTKYAVPIHYKADEPETSTSQAHVLHQLKVLKPLKVYAGRRDAEKTIEEAESEKKNNPTTTKSKKLMKDIVVEELQNLLSLVQCRFCGEYPEDFVTVTSEKPYLVNNRTSLTMNGLTVDLDFNNTLPKAVCRYCDGKLKELHDFVKQVKEAQDTLINVTEEIETVIIKTESQLEDTKEEEMIEVDSVTGETDYVKHTVYTHKNKRKNESAIDVKKQKQKVTKDIAKKRRVEINDRGCENSETIIDIKEETVEKDESGAEMENSEVSDTGTDVKPSDNIDLKFSDLLKTI